MAYRDEHVPSDHLGPPVHPVLPDVHDEASESAAWVPISGIVLLAFFLIYGAWKVVEHRRAESEAPAAEAPAAEAPAAPEAPPAQ